jgi:hypothetical protein
MKHLHFKKFCEQRTLPAGKGISRRKLLDGQYFSEELSYKEYSSGKLPLSQFLPYLSF